MADSAAPELQFSHLALFYTSTQQYLAAVSAHVQASIERREPVCIAVPSSKIELLRAGLDGDSAKVAFADMGELGRNPARIIPQMRAFIDDHPGQRFSYVAELAWAAARSAEELREAARHEALINLALADAAGTILCPYDAVALAPAVIADAMRTHPAVVQGGLRHASPDYPGKDGMPPGCEQPLPAPPASAESITYTTDLRAARRLVARHAERAGFAAIAADLVLAVGEIAANTLRHAVGGGTLHVWHTDEEILCQLHDQGRIADPLAGRVRCPPDAAGGQGLWLVNQICDLAELRTGRAGTTFRLRMRRPHLDLISLAGESRLRASPL